MDMQLEGRQRLRRFTYSRDFSFDNCTHPHLDTCQLVRKLRVKPRGDNAIGNRLSRLPEQGCAVFWECSEKLTVLMVKVGVLKNRLAQHRYVFLICHCTSVYFSRARTLSKEQGLKRL
jgi:hypothetical protein